MLSAEQVKQFQVLYERRFDKCISEQEAFDMGMKLVLLMKLAKAEQHKTLKKRDERSCHDNSSKFRGHNELTPIQRTG